jgi:hypothetical protein
VAAYRIRLVTAVAMSHCQVAHLGLRVAAPNVVVPGDAETTGSLDVYSLNGDAGGLAGGLSRAETFTRSGAHDGRRQTDDVEAHR